MKKQTATDWLYFELVKRINPHGDNGELWAIHEQAEAMEKQIIAQAFEDGDYNYFYNPDNGKEFENGIEYYNKKFKSE